jgi:hypothetical protein
MATVCLIPRAHAQPAEAVTVGSSLPNGTVIPSNTGGVAGAFDLTSQLSAGEKVESALVTLDFTTAGTIALPCQFSGGYNLFGNAHEYDYFAARCAYTFDLPRTGDWDLINVYEGFRYPYVSGLLYMSGAVRYGGLGNSFDTGWAFAGIWTDTAGGCGFLGFGPCQHAQWRRDYGFSGPFQIRYALEGAALQVLNQTGSVPFSLYASSESNNSSLTLHSSTITYVTSTRTIRGGTTRMNFDEVTASATSADCTPAGGYLAGFGVAVAGVTPGTVVGAINQDGIAEGQAARAPSPTNMITQCGAPDQASYTLVFPAPLSGVSFARAALVSGPPGATHPEWSAHALDINGSELASTGEELITSAADVPARTFTLTAAGIVSLRIDSNKHQVATTHALLDDFGLASAAPNATTWAQVVAQVPLADGAPKRIALNPTLNKIYVAGGSLDAPATTIVDGSTLEATTGGAALDVSVDLVTNRYWGATGTAGTAIVYDGVTDQAIASPGVAGCPVDADVDPVRRLVWVGAQCSGTAAVLNADTMDVIDAAIPSGGSASGIDVNQATGIAYANSSIGVTRIDPVTLATTVTAFGRVLAVDAVSNRLYTFTGGPSVTVIDGNFEVGNYVNLPFMPSPDGPAIDQYRGRMYWATQAGDSIQVLDSTTLAVLGTVAIDPGLRASRVAVDSRRGRVYALASGAAVGSVLLVIDDAFSDNASPTTTLVESPPSPNGWHGGPVTVTLSATDHRPGSGVTSITYAIGGTSPVTLSGPSATLPPITSEGVTTVVFHATDRAGNAEADQTVTVKIDQTPPTLDLPPSVVAEATSASGSHVTFAWSAEDSLSGIGSTSADPPSGHEFPLGPSTVRVAAKDLAGNTTEGTFTVTVVDTTPPAVTVPGSITVDATGPGGAIVTFTATALDIVDGAVPSTCVAPSGSSFPIATTTVTCTARDAHGNLGRNSFTVTVRSATEMTGNTTAVAIQLGFQQGAQLLHKVAESIAAGAQTTSCNRLDAFINQVRAQTGNQLTPDQSRDLIANALGIRATLGCR